MINDPQGKTNEALALGKLFSKNNSALQVLSLRTPGEVKWILSQEGKNHTRRRDYCWEDCGSKEESVTDGGRVRNTKFYIANLCSSN